MLYVFHGTDVATGVDKAHALVASLRTKRPDASFVKIDADNWNSSAVQEHVGGQGLFSNKYIVFLDRVTEDRAAKEDLIGLVPLLKESANIFIILEGKVLTDLRKAFESYAEKVVVHDRVDSTGSGKAEFNVFALGDAVASRNTFTSWNTYRQAVDSGLPSESIIGTLFWQVKSMIVARDAATATEAGLSPFVFSKAKKYATNYSELELHNLLQQLIEIYHDGHRGLRNTELAIEKVMLGLKG